MVPNHFSMVQAVYDTGAFDLTTHDGQAAFVDAVVLALHIEDPRWGHLKKRPEQTNIHGHAEDSALYLSDTPGLSQAVDFIGGAGGPNPRIQWNVDLPRYSKADWFAPKDHDLTVLGPEPIYALPPYPGDAVFDQIGAVLFADYAIALQPPNPGMARWMGRTVYDYLAGMPTEDSIKKHRAEWRAALGLSPL
jgi:hypothetical protein